MKKCQYCGEYNYHTTDCEKLITVIQIGGSK